MKWSKRMIAMALTMVLFLGLIPVQAFAMNEETVITEETVPQTEESLTVHSSPTEPTETLPPEDDGLTPEGNMTLVDDVTDSATGKEFITVVTKNGNYFYIIIDRDKKGDATVHFLNLVDEADLLELLSEEEVQDYQDQQSVKPTEPAEPAETEPTEPEPTTPSEPNSQFDPQMDRETMVLLAMPIVGLAVGGFAAYFIFSRKKPGNTSESHKYEDDWDYDLPEEDDDAPEEDKL